jgi:2-C-methyl-D-erythritol 2,4-cyclodiphosphate synthase
VTETRVGIGFDLHGWDTGRPLYLGGVRFDGEPGLAGHSDGDVICHALGDALLGAAGLGDLGDHFPDSDLQYEGISGLDLLGAVVGKLSDAGLVPGRCDMTLVAERPHIAARRAELRANVVAALQVPVEAVSIKATRPEGLGLTGDGAGCMAIATVGPASTP